MEMTLTMNMTMTIDMTMTMDMSHAFNVQRKVITQTFTDNIFEAIWH